jgi:N-acetylglutamate synthase-like GNAT family acetyltransferase
MALLAVHPTCQHLGRGSQLLSPTLSLSHKQNAKCFVQASPAGMGLYRKFGWEDVDSVVFDFSAWGGGKGVRICLMIREPNFWVAEGGGS